VKRLAGVPADPGDVVVLEALQGALESVAGAWGCGWGEVELQAGWKAQLRLTCDDPSCPSCAVVQVEEDQAGGPAGGPPPASEARRGPGGHPAGAPGQDAELAGSG